MATSKLPVNFVVLPPKIVEIFGKIPGVYVNLRPSQVGDPPFFVSDGDFVHPTVGNFLREISSPTKVAIFFQGYSRQTGTAVVELRPIQCWADGDYPRLDFVHPSEMERIHGCYNFWGAFILAIAKVKPEMEIFAESDPYSRKFLRVARTCVVP